MNRRYSPFGQTIAEARKARGLLQRDLAALAFISTGHVKAIEQGRCRPSGGVAEKIGQVLGIRLRELWEEIPMERPRQWQ